MSNESNDKCSRCRRAGDKLFLKGDKCVGPKCALLKRNFAPGVHGASKRNPKQSVYGKQLFEKQKAKEIYGLREKQFSNYVAEAAKKTGDTGKFLTTYLESRLDNVVYRMGLGKSRKSCRQLVGHGHITVNGKKVDIPSYRTKVGEEIALREKDKTSVAFDKISEKLSKVDAPSWMNLDAKKVSAKILNAPTAEDSGFDAKSIIEFYSR